MYRIIRESLREWKLSKNRKPLILEGVRQCGKTYAMAQFGAEDFPDCAYFNLEDNPGLHGIFDGTLDPQRIIKELSLLRGKPIHSDCLIILDEIQACGRAITSLKYFFEKMPEAYVIAAGSLLGVRATAPYSFPVGKVSLLRMYPMNFEEYLRAAGEGMIVDHVKSGAPVSDAVSDKMAEHLKDYFVVGGMPEIVKSWIESRDISEVNRLQDEILSVYAKDFSKYSKDTCIGQVWDSIPAQLAKDSYKFLFGHVRKGARAKDLENGVNWLIDAGLIHKVCRADKPSPPLALNRDASVYKLYLSDVGLLRRKSGISSGFALDESKETAWSRGMIAENFALCEMKSYGIVPSYWKSGGIAEVDFLVESRNNIIPVEVKYGRSSHISSLRAYIEKYSPLKAVLLSSKRDNKEGIEVVRLCLFWVWLLGLEQE